jgi:hypothetical protein
MRTRTNRVLEVGSTICADTVTIGNCCGALKISLSDGHSPTQLLRTGTESGWGHQQTCCQPFTLRLRKHLLKAGRDPRRLQGERVRTRPEVRCPLRRADAVVRDDALLVGVDQQDVGDGRDTQIIRCSFHGRNSATVMRGGNSGATVMGHSLTRERPASRHIVAQTIQCASAASSPAPVLACAGFLFLSRCSRADVMAGGGGGPFSPVIENKSKVCADA